jgi:hypothetical protein
MKGRFYLKPIRKFEAKQLRKMGYGEFIVTGHGTYHNLLVVEDPEVIKYLNVYRSLIKVK